MMPGMGPWMMIVWAVIAILVLVLVVLGVVRLVRSLTAGERGERREVESAEEILRRRYAAGEIDEEEYLRRKQELGRSLSLVIMEKFKSAGLNFWFFRGFPWVAGNRCLRDRLPPVSLSPVTRLVGDLAEVRLVGKFPLRLNVWLRWLRRFRAPVAGPHAG